jgi:DNA-binding NarL/FixJ family response regulator
VGQVGQVGQVGPRDRIVQRVGVGVAGRERPARIVIVDDHDLVAQALAETLGAIDDFTVVGTAPDLATGLALVESQRPDVVLMDARLPDGDGASGTAEVIRRRAGTKVIVLSGDTGIEVIARAVEAGAAGFLAKTTPLQELVDAVRQVLAGAALHSPRLLASVAAHLRHNQERVGGDLSAREREVLRLLASGTGTQRIADTLVLSTHTVRNHVRNISAKLGAHSKLEAVAIATREGLLDEG